MKYTIHDLVELGIACTLVGMLIGGLITHYVSYTRYMKCVKANTEYFKLYKEKK